MPRFINSLLISFAFCVSALAKDLAEVRIESGAISREGSIIHFELPESVKISPDTQLQLVESETGQKLPVQRSKNETASLFAVIDLPFPADAEKSFTLTTDDSQSSEVYSVDDDGVGLILSAGDESILRYNYRPYSSQTLESTVGFPAAWRRSGNIHPVWSPGGNMLSEIHAESHKHHLGLWGGWVRSRFEGEEYDFWNLKNEDDEELIQFRDWIWKSKGGSVFSGFRARHSYNLTGYDENLMNEILEVRAFRRSFGFVFDYEVQQEWLMESPLELDEFRYGGLFAWRYPSWWNEEKGWILTSEGDRQVITEKSGADAKRARWIRVVGQEGSDALGFAVLSHPSNFRHPEMLRCLHDGPGLGGYVHFSQIREGAWQLERGSKHEFRYRIIAFDGILETSIIEQAWQQYASEPTIHVNEIK